MISNIIKLIFFLGALSAHAEVISDNTNEYYIFSSVANVRNGVGKDAAIIDQLVSGDAVTFLGTNGALTVEGITGEWVLVRYTKGGVVREGFVWEGNLSATQLRRGDLRFVFGVERYDPEKKHFVGGVKVVKNKGIIAQRWFYIPSNRIAKQSGIILEGCIAGSKLCLKLSFGDALGEELSQYYFAYEPRYYNDTTTTTSLFFLMSTNTIKHANLHHFESINFNYDYAVKLYKKAELKNKKDPVSYQYHTEVYDWKNGKLVRNTKK